MKPPTPHPPKLPRGHAYMRFRNNGYSIHVDFPEKKVAWLESIIQGALATLREDEEDLKDPK